MSGSGGKQEIPFFFFALFAVQFFLLLCGGGRSPTDVELVRDGGQVVVDDVLVWLRLREICIDDFIDQFVCVRQKRKKKRAECGEKIFREAKSILSMHS